MSTGGELSLLATKEGAGGKLRPLFYKEGTDVRRLLEVTFHSLGRNEMIWQPYGTEMASNRAKLTLTMEPAGSPAAAAVNTISKLSMSTLMIRPWNVMRSTMTRTTADDRTSPNNR